MKKLAIKLLLLTAPLYLIILFVSKSDNDDLPLNSSVLRLKIAKKFTHLDYLFLGPSYTYDAIDPHVFDSLGYKTFNYGIATAGPMFNKLIIDDYLNSTRSLPKNIVFNISLLTFSDASDSWHAYPIHRYLNTPISNEQIFREYCTLPDYVKMLRNSFFKSIQHFFNPPLLPAPNVYDELIKNKGYTPQYTSCNDSIIQSDEPKHKKFLDLSEPSNGKFKVFMDLILHYKNMGAHIIVCEIPTYLGENYYQESYKKKYKAMILQLKNCDIQFIPCSLPMDKNCFANMDHMNVLGAKKYTHYLIDKLQLQASNDQTVTKAERQ